MGDMNARAQLIEVVRQVRRRWRLKLALRGAVGFLVAGVLAMIAIAYTLEALKFTPTAILASRVITALVFVAAGAWFFARPLSRKVSDEQVALYLEEHEPTLDSTILSAMEATERPGDWSPELIRRLIENAIERVHHIQEGERIEREPMKRYVWLAGGVTAAAIALFAFGPAYFRHTLSAIFVISRDVEAAAPYRIDVKPGDATVAKGADQMISATLSGFDAAEAAILIRKNGGAFERVPMVKADNGAYEGMLFDLAEPIDYVIEAAGVKSTSHKLTVVELPYAKKIDLEYTYPSYTGLEPRKIEDGGDIAVLKGTDVKLTITPTMATKGGHIVLGEKETVPLSANADGTLSGHFIAAKDGSYRIELDSPKGERLTASPQYTVDLLSDLAPTVKLSKPGRDTDATPVEEFFVEAQADDDYAVKNLQLVYQINGGPEKVIPLFGGARASSEVTAGHTFYMEELGVKAGDSVSYFARATDNDAVNGAKQTSSDIYFLRIRPFDKNFKPATSMSGGGGGGGGGGQEVGALSQQQRQIIAGTFNIQRDRKTMTAAKFREGMVVLTLAQSKLRDQVNGLVDRMNSRLTVSDPSFKKIAELLPKAAEHMTAAEKKLQSQSPDGALPPENQALQFLQQAEEEFELQVQTGRQAGGGGGGGGGAGSIAQDLADLFKMEMDKMANQYETNSQASTQQQDQQIDELAEKLKELARRQEQEIERQRRLAAGQSAGGNSGDLQRALADQAEEAARQLEKLSREQQRQDLADTARQLRNAADSMRRAAAKGDPSAAGQAAAAADRLREAQRQLQRNQTARGERDVRDAQRQAAEIAQEQEDIARDAGQLGQAGPDRLQKAQLLGQRKDSLEGKVADLEKQLDRMVGEQTRESRDTGRKLSEAAAGIRDNKIKEKIRYSKSLLGSGAPEQYARNFEEEIGANIDQLRKKLDDAASSVGQQGRDRSGDALDKARDLARGVDSMGRRMQERGQQNAQARDGKSGQQASGQSGQQGKEGQQGRESGQQASGQSGQQGQSGKEGSQGQSGKEGSQGQQGQGGQGGQQGQNGEGGRDGRGDTRGDMRDGGWGGGDNRAGGPYGYYFGPDDVRQFRGEARRYLQEGQQLRQMLREQNVDPKEFDEIMRRLRELDSERVYQDVDELARLQSYVAEGLKRFEYALRRKVGDETDRALVSGSEDVPAEFKALVEEYYRSLSKGRQNQNQQKQ
jgi:hypothetical protein